MHASCWFVLRYPWLIVLLACANIPSSPSTKVRNQRLVGGKRLIESLRAPPHARVHPHLTLFDPWHFRVCDSLVVYSVFYTCSALSCKRKPTKRASKRMRWRPASISTGQWSSAAVSMSWTLSRCLTGEYRAFRFSGLSICCYFS